VPVVDDLAVIPLALWRKSLVINDSREFAGT